MTVIPIRFIWWWSSGEEPIFEFRSALPAQVIGSTGNKVFSIEGNLDSQFILPLFALQSGRCFATKLITERGSWLVEATRKRGVDPRGGLLYGFVRSSSIDENTFPYHEIRLGLAFSLNPLTPAFNQKEELGWEDIEFNGLPVGLEYDTTLNYPDHEVPKEIVRPTRFERPWVV